MKKLKLFVLISFFLNFNYTASQYDKTMNIYDIDINALDGSPISTKGFRNFMILTKKI